MYYKHPAMDVKQRAKRAMANVDPPKESMDSMGSMGSLWILWILWVVCGVLGVLQVSEQRKSPEGRKY